MSPIIEKLKVLPATAERWPALEDLFHDGGPCRRCWCMYWRIGSAYRRQAAEKNQASFRQIVEKGPAPGLIAFADELAVGWCQFTPREDLPWLERNWRRKAPDNLPVWSISCFYIRKGYRRRGITTALVRAAIKQARKAGVERIEAYPLDAELSPSASGTGYVSIFARLGFEIVAKPNTPRPVMRYEVAR